MRHCVRHSRAQPYRPKTNGKAKRFIQTITRAYSHSDERLAHLQSRNRVDSGLPVPHVSQLLNT